MKLKAILQSISAHLGIAALALYIHTKSQYPKPADNLVIEAPLGNVFVLEESSPGTSTEETASPVISDSEAAYPHDGKKPAASSSFGERDAGLPDGEAKPIGKIQPVYPAISRKLGEEGEVIFLLGIDAEGFVTSATIEHPSGYPRLDESARRSLLDAKFEPSTSSGMPVLSMKRFRVEFQLSEKSR